MPLSDLVAAAKKAPSIKFHSKTKAITDSEKQGALAEKHVSLNALAQQLKGERDFVLKNEQPEQERSWEKCKFLQKNNGMNACTQFASRCSEEKCPKRYMQC